MSLVTIKCRTGHFKKTTLFVLVIPCITLNPTITPPLNFPKISLHLPLSLHSALFHDLKCSTALSPSILSWPPKPLTPSCGLLPQITISPHHLPPLFSKAHRTHGRCLPHYCPPFTITAFHCPLSM